MAQPKCPECGVEGLDKIVSAESKERSKGGDAWFNVAYCEACGHIHGVFVKNTLTHEVTAEPPSLRIPR